MAWTQEDLDRLNRAIRSGAKSVRYADGKAVDYRSVEEMFAIREQIERELGAVRPARKVMAHSKGLEIGGLDRTEWS